jgi:hypothetical protein
MDENHPLWKKRKWRPAPLGHDRFVCDGCGAHVYRRDRPFDDADKCLNCWSKINNEEDE